MMDLQTLNLNFLVTRLKNVNLNFTFFKKINLLFFFFCMDWLFINGF
jgi:hypothetical protein